MATIPAAIPNPLDWAADRVGDLVDGVVGEGFELVVNGLVAWVVDAVVWVVGGVFNYFGDATDPNVQADWFVGPGGPYATTAGIGATLMAGFVLAGVAQGALAGDVGGMLRRMALDVPLSVVGIVGLVTFTQVLVRVTDVLSTEVMRHFEADVGDFVAVVVSLGSLGGGVTSALVVFVLGLVTVLAGLTLVAELSIRAALIYIVVALAPLVFAAQVWPALKGVGHKLLRLLCALILSKLAMSVALAVSAAAAVGVGSGGEVTALPEPEAVAEDPGGSTTQAVGILLASVVSFGVAAGMPFLVARLLPLAEDAAIAQGLRGGPLRLAQQGTSMAYYSQTLPRFSRGAQATRPARPPDQGSGTLAPGPALGAGVAARQLAAGTIAKGALPAGPRPMPPGPGNGAPATSPAPPTPGGSDAGSSPDLTLGVAVPRGVAVPASSHSSDPSDGRPADLAGAGAEILPSGAARPTPNRPQGVMPPGARRIANTEDVVPPPSDEAGSAGVPSAIRRAKRSEGSGR